MRSHTCLAMATTLMTTTPMPGHGYHTHATIPMATTPMPSILYSTLYTKMVNYRIIPLQLTNYRIIPLFLVMEYDSVV